MRCSQPLGRGCESAPLFPFSPFLPGSRTGWKHRPTFRAAPHGSSLVATLLLACALAFDLFAAVPTVTRVEPPNWWTGHSHNPVRLLLSGENLTAATVKAPSGFRTANIRASADGNYLFVDLTIPSHAAPGMAPLRVTTTTGTAIAPFIVFPPLPRESRFQGFSPDDVIYLLMPDRFANGDPDNDNPEISHSLLDRSQPRHYHGGDLQGVKNQLGYLKDLGVTALWMTPWYDNVNHLNVREKYTADNQRSPVGVPSTDYHGYGAVEFYAVEERFGDLAQLQSLVRAAQGQGLKIIQDQVANHTGPYHHWTTNPPTPTWFNGTVDDHLENIWQIWTVTVSNPPPDKLKATLEGWFINILPDLNQNDPDTATYLIQNSLWWVGMTGLDAIRQDTLPYVPRSYWAQWTTAVKREHPHLTILGEMWHGDPKLVAFFQGGRAQFDGVDSGVDTLFDFPLYYAIRDVFAKGQPMTRLSETLAADTNYVNARVLTTFLGLHDMPRFLNEPGATVDGLKLAFSFLLTARGTPILYFGDEIAMRGGGDPDNRRDFPGGWPEDERNAFERDGRTAEEESVHAHVRKLLHLRRDLEPLRRGEMVTLHADRSTFAFARVTPRATAIVVFNNATEPQTMDVPLANARLRRARSLTDQLGTLGRMRVTDGSVKVTLPPRTAAILVP